MDRPVVKEADAAVLFATPPQDYTLELLRKWLATTKAGPAMFDPQAIVDIPEGFSRAPTTEADRAEGHWNVRWSPNWGSIKSTTVGRFIANNLIFSRSRKMREAFPYVDKAWDGKVVGDIQQSMMDAMLDGKIDYEDMVWAIDRLQWLGYAPTCFLAPSMTIDTVRLPKEARRVKQELLKGERGDKIRAGDLKELGAVEKDVVAAAKAVLDGKDPGFDIFASGARGSVG